MHVASLHYCMCLHGMDRDRFVFERVNLQQILHYCMCLHGMHRDRFVFERVNVQQIRPENLQSVSFTFALIQEAYFS